MKRLAAQYIFTNTGNPLKMGLITSGDDGTVLDIEDTKGSFKEKSSVEFFNGVIIPGFVNCHAHLELSHLKGKIAQLTGLADFIMAIRNIRENDKALITSSAASADRDLFEEGVELCADICNSTVTFPIKKASHIRYINLAETFGIDPLKATKRLQESIMVQQEAEKAGLPCYIVPHSTYSVSLSLFRLLKEKTLSNKVTSIHFMEAEEEKLFLAGHSGPLRHSYEQSGLYPENPELPAGHIDTILNELTPSGNLILVHNTFADKETVSTLNERGEIFWCICPCSNLYIGGEMPPVDILTSAACKIVIGTDSLASNSKLSMLSEMKAIQEHFPEVSLEELVRWATLNGAIALGEDNKYGKIESGMKPGLLLLENLDLVNLRLLPETTITRLF